MSQRYSRRSLLICAWALLAVITFFSLYGLKVSSSGRDAHAEIAWSQPQLELTLFPGETRRLDVIFSSNEPLNNVTVRPVPEISQFVTLEPQLFSAIRTNEPQTLRITFSIPANAALRTHEGTIHIRTGSRTIPQTLKVLLTVTTPQQTLLDLAGEIETGDIQSALRGFSASPLNQQVLIAMDRDQRRKLATNFRNAQLSMTTPTLWVFRTPWHEADGTTSQVEFSLGRKSSGEWIICNW